MQIATGSPTNAVHRRGCLTGGSVDRSYACMYPSLAYKCHPHSAQWRGYCMQGTNHNRVNNTINLVFFF